jgi:hypothetical protein
MARLTLEEGTTLQGAIVKDSLGVSGGIVSVAAQTSLSSLPPILLVALSSAQNIRLPPHVKGMIQYGIIGNVSVGASTATIQDSTGAAIGGGVTVAQNAASLLVSDGTAWRKLTLT